MNKGLTLLLTGAAIVGLSACSSGGAGTDQGNGTADAENSSTDTTTADDANNPFAEAEQRMNEQMMAAVGVNAGDSWVRKMIVHHQGAIDMSKIMLEQNPTPDVAKMARDAIAKQTKEIGDLQKLVKQGTPDPKSAEIYRAVSMKMQQDMMAAKGATISETFMKKMLAHHLGGAELADVALDKAGVTGVLRLQVEKTHDGQHKDAEMTEAMIGGASMEQAMKASNAKSAKEAIAEPTPADKAQATPRPSKPAPKATTPAADPHAGHDMDNMSDMSGMDHK